MSKDIEPGKPLSVNEDRALRRELRLERRAIRNGWNVPEQMKADIISDAWSISKNAEIDPRTRIAAGKLGLEASKLQFDVIEAEIRDDKLDHEESTENVANKIEVVYRNTIIENNADD